jgi:predicted transcriptional regulator
MREDILTIDVSTIEATKARMRDAFKGKGTATARYSFLSAEDMARMLTPSRWRIIAAMTGAGALGVREVARRVERDVKGVHNDLSALASNGLIDREGDKYLFPYRQVKVAFELRAAA